MSIGSDGGRRGERAAARHLRRRGWTVLTTGWRGAGGEIDLVAARGGVLALCEVKARSDPAALLEPVTAAQRARIRRAAEAFVASRPDLAGLRPRLDLLTVRLGPVWARVRHQPGAVGDP
jgi:putative endonuclease